MKKRRCAALCAAAWALCALLSACAGEGAPVAPSAPVVTEAPAPAAPTQFTLAKTEASMHPVLSEDKTNLALSGLIWEGLFALDEAFAPRPVLCKSYAVSEDGLTWTCLLQTQAAFSDGSPLTATEVVDTLNLARSASTRFAQRLSGITRVEAAGDGAVVITLSSPNGNLPALLDVPIVKGDSEEPLGTGPYRLDGWGDSLRLLARRDWWQGGDTLPLETIALKTITTGDQMIQSLDAKELTMVATDLLATGALGFAGDYEVWDYPTSTMVFLGYQTSRGPCASATLRQALDHGLDRAGLATTCFSQHALATALPVSPVSALYSAALDEQRAHHPQEMQTLLEQAGYKQDEQGNWMQGRHPLQLTLVVNSDNRFRLAAAEYLADSLSQAGIAIELKRLAWNDYLAALAAGNFDLYLGAVTLSADWDLSALLTSGGALNYGRYYNGETAALLAQVQAATGEGRTGAAHALYERLAEQVPFSTLCFQSQSLLVQWGVVSGLAPTQQNPFYNIPLWTIANTGK